MEGKSGGEEMNREEMRVRIDEIEKLPTYAERTRARLRLLEDMEVSNGK